MNHPLGCLILSIHGELGWLVQIEAFTLSATKGRCWVLHMGYFGVAVEGAGWSSPKVCCSLMSSAEGGANRLLERSLLYVYPSQYRNEQDLPVCIVTSTGSCCMFQSLNALATHPTCCAVPLLSTDCSKWCKVPCDFAKPGWKCNTNSFSGEFFLLGTSGQGGKVIKTTFPWAFWHFQPPPVNRVKADDVFISRAAWELALSSRFPNSLLQGWVQVLSECSH